MFGQWPETAEFTEACGLLCEAGLVEWQGGALGLTPKGRKFLRRAGRHGAAGRPKLVTDLLQGIDDKELADEGSVPEPSEEQVASVLRAMLENPYLAESFQSAPVSYSFIGLSAYGAQVPHLNAPPMVPLGESDGDEYDEYDDEWDDEESGEGADEPDVGDDEDVSDDDEHVSDDDEQDDGNR
jgi:hypothetical protein